MGHIITVTLKAISKDIAKTFNELANKQNALVDRNKRIAKVAGKTNEAYQQNQMAINALKGQMKDLAPRVHTMNRSLIETNRTQAGLVQTTKKQQKVGNQWKTTTIETTKGLEGFRMEMLGVMFFGMQMQKTFMGMLTPAAEAFGIFDLWKTMLLVVFLPIMETLAPILYSFMIWFMELDPAVQKGIGAFVIFGAVLGTLLFAMGVLGLGIVSLAQWFPVLFGGLSAGASIPALLAGAVTTLIGTISGLSTAILSLPATLFTFGTELLTAPSTTEAVAVINRAIDNIPKGVRTGIGIALLVVLAVTVSKALEDAKGGTFDASTALWDSLSAGFTAGMAARMFGIAGKYSVWIGIATTIVLGVAFVLETDFGKKIKMFWYETMNKIIEEYNKIVVNALPYTFASLLPEIPKLKMSAELSAFAGKQYREEFGAPKWTEFAPPPIIPQPISIESREQAPTIRNITVAPVFNISNSTDIDERALAEQIGELVSKEVNKM